MKFPSTRKAGRHLIKGFYFLSSSQNCQDIPESQFECNWKMRRCGKHEVKKVGTSEVRRFRELPTFLPACPLTFLIFFLFPLSYLHFPFSFQLSAFLPPTSRERSSRSSNREAHPSLLFPIFSFLFSIFYFLFPIFSFLFSLFYFLFRVFKCRPAA
jgi:hypothetical protein